MVTILKKTMGFSGLQCFYKNAVTLNYSKGSEPVCLSTVFYMGAFLSGLRSHLNRCKKQLGTQPPTGSRFCKVST